MTQATSILEQTDVFVSGRDGYHTYRIPAVVLTPSGTLLAFCEGRRNSRADHGDIDLLVKRSTDHGRSWCGQILVYGEEGEITIGNPCPVVDQDTGRIWIGFTRDNKNVLATCSDDDGATWSTPTDITQDVKRPDWTWYATGPVNGIQLRVPPHAGRLVLPCDHRERERDDSRTGGHSHIIYSDDHGANWQLGGVTDCSMNECSVAELVDGRLMLNMRSYRGKHQRAVAMSEDGGLSWSTAIDQAELLEPVCQASLLRHSTEPDGGRNRLLFSNPASPTRDHMTVRLSYDEGKTWPVARCIWSGPAAYSCLVVLPDRTVGCLHERGESSPYEKLTFARFDIRWLTDGADAR